ncbi:MAG: GIY-YIG nuclease family protein [Bacilli bacterium]|nr:GIY-YIG nuclease family protein [Bacilli bacterium]
MIKSKTINVFLMDGDPTLRIKCTLQNWTGIAYKIPRTMLEQCKEGKNDIVKHLKQTGIYFLLGEDVSSGSKAIYIGQAVSRKNGDGLLCRLLEHQRNIKEKYWGDWNEVIVFTTQNDSFGPTEISYLENKFTNLARESGRYDVKNGNEPNPGNFTEEKESELLEFIDYARIIMGVLGHKAFEEIVKMSNSQNIQSKEIPIFHFKGKYNAQGIITNEGFVVLKGSQISNEIKQSARDSVAKARKANTNRINNYVLSEDILFTSPSAAADFVGGCSLSGNVVWKTDDGKCPKDFNF